MKQRHRKHRRPVRDRWLILWRVDSAGVDWRAEVAALAPAHRMPPLPVYNEVWRLLGLGAVDPEAKTA